MGCANKQRSHLQAWTDAPGAREAEQKAVPYPQVLVELVAGSAGAKP